MIIRSRRKDAVPGFRLEPFLGPSGQNRIERWLEDLDKPTRMRIQGRLSRPERGLFGDHRHLGQCLFELREHFGSGYRIYVGLASRDRLILLLGGGDKSSQASDIMITRYDWSRYLEKHP
jgi:putative addiction module killer protein